MFGFFSKKTTKFSEELFEQLPNQSIAWEIHVNYNKDLYVTNYHVITGQKPINLEEFQDFHRLYTHNKSKKNAKSGEYLDSTVFTSKMFKDFLRTFSGSSKDDINPYDFMSHIILKLSGIQKVLLEREFYFSDHERYITKETRVHWSFLDQECYFDEEVLPLTYILLYSHKASKSYHSLCFEGITDDTLDYIFENKIKGYSLLDSSKSTHFVSDFSI